MKIEKTKIEGLLIIEPQVFRDERGFFMETYNKKRYREVGVEFELIQDNLSKSSKGTLRGLHYQEGGSAQGKLVQVISGRVLDVAVDIRDHSSTFGEYVAIELSGKSKKQFWIPPGMAHGFVSLEDGTILSYKCTTAYDPNAERGIMWNDPDLKIDWRLEENRIIEPIISEKDKKNILFKNIKNN